MRHIRRTTRRTSTTPRSRRCGRALPVVMLLVLLVVLAAGGCVGRRYVRQQVERLDDRLAAVEREPGATAATLSAHQARLAETAKLATLALERAREAERRLRETPPLAVAYSVDGIRFPSNSSRLTAEAESLLDQLATRLRLEDQAAHLEIRSSADGLGEARGMAVRRHLHVAGGVPLHAMRVLSVPDALAGGDTAATGGLTEGEVAITVLRPPSLP